MEKTLIKPPHVSIVFFLACAVVAAAQDGAGRFSCTRPHVHAADRCPGDARRDEAVFTRALLRSSQCLVDKPALDLPHDSPRLHAALSFRILSRPEEAQPACVPGFRFARAPPPV